MKKTKLRKTLCTFVLNRLALIGRSATSDGATDEDDELLDAGALKVTEVAHIGGVG